MSNIRHLTLGTIIGTAIIISATTFASSHGAPPASQPAASQPAANTAITPAPRDERWQAHHKSIVENAKHGGFEFAFLGDSITQGWAGAGKEVWEKRYAPRHAINLGIGGDRTQHVLWRLDHGLIEALKQEQPRNNIKAVVLMIGTNNSGGIDNTAEEIADGIKAIVATLHREMPQTQILLLAIFPRGGKPNPQREKNANASELASKIADGKMVHYLDIGPKFLADDGTLSKDIMPDLLHLSPTGYEIWADAIEAKIAEILK